MSEGYQKPPERPRVRAIANIQQPGRVRDIGGVALPAPHLDEDAMGRGWLGADEYGSREEMADNRSMYARFPYRVIEAMRDVVWELSDVYGGNIGAFIRHAVYELLWLHLQRRQQEGKDPASLRYLAELRALRLWAWHLDSEKSQLKYLLIGEEHISKSVDLKLWGEVHQALASLRDMLAYDSTETWLAEFRRAVGKSEAVASGVNALVKAWARSESKWEHTQAQEWEAWWDNLKTE